MKMSAALFKARCLKLMDQVNATHEEVTITKHGKPVAKLVPCSARPSRALYGCLRGSVTIKGDIIAPVASQWEAETAGNDRA
ncbi:MAG: type II toxin-antitoxin system prevent-host-death family antitoxin [Planctomycetota bacterium]